MDAQLSLERVGREIKAHSHIFRSDGDRIASLISKAESHVNDVIDDWEKHPLAIVVGADGRSSTRELKHLQKFLDSAGTGGFKANVSRRVEEVECLIRSQLLSSSNSHACTQADDAVGVATQTDEPNRRTNV